MRKIETCIYTYDELPPETQETVRDMYAVDPEWHEYTIEHYQERLEAIGFANPIIHFSIGGQGEGACFDADIDLEKIFALAVYCTEEYSKAKDYLRLISLANQGTFYAVIFTNNHRYCHERTRSISIEMKLFPSATVQRLQILSAEYLEMLRLRLCEEIFSTLQKEYDYRTSHEVFRESAEANEWEFYANGEMV